MAWPYDLIIFFYLISVGAFLVETAHRWKETRHRVVVGSVAVVLALSWMVIFYGSFIEPRFVAVHETAITLSASPRASLRAALIGDIHLGPYKGASWTETVVRELNAQKPDIIFLVGDYVADQPDDAKGLAPLAELEAPLGVWAVTGNHDYYGGDVETVVRALNDAGVHVLHNMSVPLEWQGKPFVLAGVSDLWNEGDVQQALKDVSDDDTTLLLSHNPDVVLLSGVSLADLVLSGHTHGGQIRLPGYGPVPQIPDALGQQYDKGLFPYAGKQLFITSGVGETGTRARLFNPPTIDVLRIDF